MSTGSTTTRMIDSTEFTVAVAWGLVLVGVAGPLLLECLRHFSGGYFLFGCVFGVTGLPVAGLSLWKAATNLEAARRRTGSV